MDALVSRLISKYGSHLILERQDERIPLRALLQPMLSRQVPQRRYAPAGEVPRGRYLYMGPVVPEITEGDILIRGGRRYEIRQAELLMYGDRPVYRWAMCVEKGR